MSLYDVTSETDRMRSERATVRTLGARMDADVRNPNVGWNSPELVPNSAIDQRQRAGEETTSAQDIADAITAAIADRGEIAEWLADKTYTTLAAVAAVGYQTAAQVTALANAAIDTALALGGKIYNKAYTTIQGVIDAGFQKAAQVTALANAAITAAIANGQAIYNAISTFITNAIADAGALATWLANKTYTTLSAVQNWVNGLALASAENIYEWSAQAVHDISATDAARQLYRDNTVGTSTQAQAGPLDYMQAAIFGAHDPEERTPPRMEPKTIGEWIESITDRIFAVGQDAITWLGEQGATLTSTIFGAFASARAWLDAQGLATATTIYRWTAQAVHGISATDAARQLYKDNTSGNTEVNEAGPLDYMQAAIFGAWDPDDGNPPRMEPKTLGEWITDIAHGIFGAGKDAIAWLGERATEVKNLVFGAGVKAAQWIADTLTTTAQDAQEVVTAVGNAADAIAQKILGTTATVADTVWGWLTGDTTTTPSQTTKSANRPPIVLTSSGDLNMQTQDMVNVDRIFLNSNDSMDLQSSNTHITSSGPDSNSMYLFVPRHKSYFFNVKTGNPGSTDVNGILSLGIEYAHINGALDVEGEFQAKEGMYIGNVKDINVPTRDGSIWLDGPNIKARSGNKTVSLSDLNATAIPRVSNPTGAEPTPFTPNPPSGALWLPVAVYSGSISSVTTAQLEGWFGTGPGSVGIIRPAVWPGSNIEQSVCIVWRTGVIRTSSAWIGVRCSGAVNPSTLTGRRDTVLAYSKKRAYLTTSGNRDVAIENIQPTSGTGNRRIAGAWGVHYKTGDEDNGTLYVMRSQYNVDMKNNTNDFGNSSTAFGTSNTLEVSPMKSLWTVSHPFSASTLDSQFGVDDGYIGEYKKFSGSNRYRIYVKANGRWFYIALPDSDS